MPVIPRITIERARVIYGLPTTGKTQFARWLSTIGVNCVDTDDIIRDRMPGWFAKKGWRDATDVQRRNVSRQVGVALRDILDHNENAVAVTNLWDPEFRAACAPYMVGPDKKIPIGFWRSSATEVAELSVSRGGTPFPKRLATSWVRSFEKYGPESVQYRLDLSSFAVERADVDATWRVGHDEPKFHDYIITPAFIGDVTAVSWAFVSQRRFGGYDSEKYVGLRPSATFAPFSTSRDSLMDVIPGSPPRKISVSWDRYAQSVAGLAALTRVDPVDSATGRDLQGTES